MLNEQVEVNEDGEIKCICMNEPSWDGFSACHRNGQVDDNLLSKHNVDSIYYLCQRCGRIINEKTLEVVAMLQSDEENYDDVFSAALAMEQRARRMYEQAMLEKPWNVEEMMGDLAVIERLLVCLQKVKLQELQTF